MLFHIFGHIDPYKSALVAEHYLGKSLCKLSLTDTCGTKEDECARRSLLILKTKSSAADSLGDGMNGLVLADDSFRELSLKILKLIGIRFRDLGYRDSGPLCKNDCNIVNR